MFELPGVLVWDVHGVQADLHGGVDVAARAVANHPSVGLHDFVLAHQCTVSFRVLLGNDLDEFEETCNPERSTLAACSAGSPLVNKIRRWRSVRYASVSGTPSRIFGGVRSRSTTRV